jgi:hypothetical protein
VHVLGYHSCKNGHVRLDCCASCKLEVEYIGIVENRMRNGQQMVGWTAGSSSMSFSVEVDQHFLPQRASTFDERLTLVLGVKHGRKPIFQQLWVSLFSCLPQVFYLFIFFLNATIILQNIAASLIIQCKLNDVIIVPKSISFNSLLCQHTQKDKKFVLKANKKNNNTTKQKHDRHKDENIN